MRLLLGALLLCQSGCFPVYKLQQPDAKMTVLDGLGKPVHGAKVTLIASSVPHGRERGRSEVTTDSNGMAEFQSIRAWRIESLMIHGIEYYYWNWCVEKEGFKTEVTRDRRAEKFNDSPTVILSGGGGQDCSSEIQNGESLFD